MRKKLKIFNVLFIVSLILLIISIILDILILNGEIAPFIKVSNTYIDSIFSGILTFSTLSLTLLTIIISIVDVKIYGLKIREILLFKSSPIRFLKYIVFSVLLTLFSIMALMFNLCTFITFIAIIHILYTTVISVMIFKVMSNVNITKTIVFNEIASNGISLSNYVVSWINEYEYAIIHNNQPDIKIYAEILKKCSKNQQICETICNYLPELFNIAYKYHSFSDSIYYSVTQIMGLYSEKAIIFQNYINNIKYCSEYELQQLNLPETIDNILTSPYLLNSEKVEFVYSLFDTVISKDMKQNVKLRLLRSSINKITKITENQNGDIKSEVVLQITINNIILINNDIYEKIYDMLLKSLYINNLLNKDIVFINTMARIFRAFYFYGVLDRNILNEEQHTIIKNMVKKELKAYSTSSNFSMRNFIITFDKKFLQFYILDSFELEYLIVDSSDINNRYPYELWNSTNKIKFSLWFYFANSYVNDDFLNEDAIAQIRNKCQNSDYHRNVFSDLLDEYNTEKQILTDSCIENIQCIKDYIKSILTGNINKAKIINTLNQITLITQEFTS